jgi:hypothetical protein
MIKRNSFSSKYVNVSEKETSAVEARLSEGQFLLEGQTLNKAKSDRNVTKKGVEEKLKY